MIDNTKIRQIRALISRICTKAGLDPDDYKKDVVFGITGGRTDHVTELNYAEANNLIAELSSKLGRPVDPGDKIRKSIMRMCYEMQIINEVMTTGQKLDAINAYIERHSKMGNKKQLTQYTVAELRKLYYQFEISYKYYLGQVK